MLFTSNEFVFAFLPIVLAGFYALARIRHEWALVWLTGASLAFYAWWNPPFTLLLILSIAFNLGCVRAMAAGVPGRGRWPVAVAVGGNLLALAFFKYSGFAVASINALTGLGIPIPALVLPLGISFFTFTQLGFVLDAHRGLVRDDRWVHYSLFVTYFPHLIAGPLLHHAEVMPQFGAAGAGRLTADRLARGFSLFSMGLAKKVLLADRIGPYATGVFTAVGTGVEPEFVMAWTGALAYTLQLYFDFSGYTDMALGISALFGIRLPENFNAPYKAESIIQFWQRWHMTLTRFLRDYLFMPLAGWFSRRLDGVSWLGVRDDFWIYAGAMVTTMLLAGLWHGAGWTFVAWGALHGVYLAVNQAWRHLRRHPRRGRRTVIRRLASQAATFLAVVVAWVLFRAASFGDAGRVLGGMCGLNGLSLPTAAEAYLTRFQNGLGDPSWLRFRGLFPVRFPDGIADPTIAFLLVGVGLFVVWVCPTSADLIDRHLGVQPHGATPPRLRLAVWCGLLLAGSLMARYRVSEFLYYQF